MLESRPKRGGFSRHNSLDLRSTQTNTAGFIDQDTNLSIYLAFTTSRLEIRLLFEAMTTHDADVASLVPQTPFQEQYLSSPQ